ncbi:two-component system osmolarity sensor histidine kinase EnvZ [Aureimonas jatrophae]|uniref:histidine kinase n=1 Tax=Aureimonas jatrophae TaxID=1166073 RepID=A0A1H0LKB2_9HYPH|nr:two-component system osmolarity sensor histidine kinase EnvZ [Aureimonas jatrophae]SDO68624.1 two-component system, OmpR family, osmolarity sensor histidine kinase EnvZ [Aureimonas jatrophae]
MTLLDRIRPGSEAITRGLRGFRLPALPLGPLRGPLRRGRRFFSRRTPKGLYARSLIIIIAPMVLLQSVVAFVFMERHWQTVTQRLSTAVVQDIAAVIDIIDTYPQDADFANVTRIARDALRLNVLVLPPEPLPAPAPKPFFNILDGILSEEITNQINRPFWIDTVGESRIVEIRIQLPDHVLRVFAPRNSAYASNTHIFLLWMVGTSLVLLLIAILFLRNQIRPIQKLAEAADGFGRGQPMPPDFRVRGASEVRRASLAFIQMRDRIERQIEQRTQMLNGVSHDLRTVLTRFRLQLAIMEDSEDRRELEHDVDEMGRMLEGYLAFAKGEAGEDVGELDLERVFAKFEADAALNGVAIETDVSGDPSVTVRPAGFTRILNNLVANAMRHGSRLRVQARKDGRWLTVSVEDDGPGIAPEQRDEVFKPFVRLDEARNIDAGGTGLGLAIARDIARSHGGDILLSDSSLGGLKAMVRVPA